MFTAAPPPGYPAPADPARSRWPVIVSIVALVWAGFCLIGLVGQALTPVMMRMTDAMDPQLAAVQPSLLFTLVTTAIALTLLVLLVVGAIKLLLRHPGGVRLLKLWAWLAALNTIAMAPMAWLMQKRTFEVQSQIQPGDVLPDWFGTVMATFSVVMILLLGLALPVFLLIWFARRPIKEDVAGWGPTTSG